MTAVLPLHLDLVDKEVVVVGGGRIAAGKVDHLRQAGARVTVIAPALDVTLAAAVRDGAVRWIHRRYRTGDLGAAWLVFAATDVPEVNAAVAGEAEGQRAFCVRVDDGRAGTARTPLVIRQGDLVLGVSSADTTRVAPARLKSLRGTLHRALGAAV